MDVVSLAMLLAVAVWWLKGQWQRKRIVLLAGYLGRYQIERQMEALMNGYLRAAGESDAERSLPIWRAQEATEAGLCQQFDRFAQDVAAMPAQEARVITQGLGLPWLDQWLPLPGFDVREMFRLHAQALRAACQHGENDSAAQRRQQAYVMSAELLLMQHTCHWYCRSRALASARLLARHQTSYGQVVESVAPATRAAYERLLQGR